MNGISVTLRGDTLAAVQFHAMASPCELLLSTVDLEEAGWLGGLAAAEAWRIERKYSRYRDDSVIGVLNRNAGKPVELDEETRALLDFAAQCHRLSDGAFDITSGVLRRAWRFDGSNRLPTPGQIAALRMHIGFERLQWQDSSLTVPEGMELDLGGIGKEYAVDRALAIVAARIGGAVLVNFGGDLAANRAPAGGAWKVGVERPDLPREARLLLEFERGGLATSGDSHRYIEHAGQRFSHILDVRTGYPVRGAPRSVTVAASSCVEAGLLATLAMLKGADAEGFLEEQGATHWCLRQQSPAL